MKNKMIRTILIALLLIGISGGATMWAIDNMKDKIVAEANVKIKEAMRPSRIEVLQMRLEENREVRANKRISIGELEKDIEVLEDESDIIKEDIEKELGF